MPQSGTVRLLLMAPFPLCAIPMSLQTVLIGKSGWLTDYINSLLLH